MSNEIIIQKIEYDFEIDDPKIQQYYAHTCKRISEDVIGNILIRLFKEHEFFQSNKEIFIDKIEIDINQIFIQELSDLSKFIELHLKNEIFDISKVRNDLIVNRLFEDFLVNYKKNNFLPWWLKSQTTRNTFFNVSNIVISDYNKTLDLLISDFIFFQKVYSLFDEDKREPFIRKVLGRKYDLFLSIVDLNEDLQSLRIYTSSYNSHKDYTVFDSLKSIREFEDDLDIEGLIQNKFRSLGLTTGSFFDEYDKYREIVTRHKKLLRKRRIKPTHKGVKDPHERQIKSTYVFIKELLKKGPKDFYQHLIDMAILTHADVVNEGLDHVELVFGSKKRFIDTFLLPKSNYFIAFVTHISLDTNNSSKVKDILSKVNQNFFDIEKDILKNLLTYRITNNSEQFIKFYLRFKLLKIISTNPYRKLPKNDIIFDIVNEIGIFGDLNKANIVSGVNNNQITDKDFRRLFISVASPDYFSGISQTSRSNLYLKDIYQYYLTQNKMPPWSKTIDISNQDLLFYLKKALDKNDFNFIYSIFENRIFLSKKLKELIDIDDKFFITLLSRIGKNFVFSGSEGVFYKFEILEDFNNILHQVFYQKLWKFNSFSAVIKKMFEIIGFRSNDQITFVVASFSRNKDREVLSLFFDHFDFFAESIESLFKKNPNLFVKAIKLISPTKLNIDRINSSYGGNDSESLFRIFLIVVKFKLWVVKSNDTINQIFSKIHQIINTNYKSDAQFIHLIHKDIREILASQNIFKTLTERKKEKPYLEIQEDDFVNNFSFVNKEFDKYHDDIISAFFIQKKSIDLIEHQEYFEFNHKIVHKLKSDESLLKKYLKFLRENQINQKLVFSIFNAKNIVEIFKLRFDSNSYKEIFYEIFSKYYNDRKCHIDSQIDLLFYFLSAKKISKYEIIDILALFSKYKNSTLDKFNRDIIHQLNNIEISPKSLPEINTSRNDSFRSKFGSTNQMQNHLIRLGKIIQGNIDLRTRKRDLSDNKVIRQKIENDKLRVEDSALVQNYIDNIDSQILISKYNTLSYFIEFGSFPYGSNFYNSGQLVKIFNETLVENPFLVKKDLFGWAKSSVKLDRFVSTLRGHFDDDKIFINQLNNLLNIIYPDLFKHLKIFSEIVIELGILKKDSFLFSEQISSQEFDKRPINLVLSDFKLILSSWPNYELVVKDISDFLVNTYLHELDLPSDQINVHELRINFSIDNEKETRRRFFIKNTIDSLNKKINIEKDSLNAITYSDSSIIDELEDGVIIYNAGLLLFWPFLITLFDKLNLLNSDKNEYLDEMSKHKAIMATDYIINGEDSQEKDFTFNKILCGIDLEIAIDYNLKLSDGEISICDGAINALLSNWKKVKSIQTLRDWFLNREGRLVENQDTFVLDVQNKPYDVFLKSLPWGISMIKNDLMSKKLVVVWKY